MKPPVRLPEEPPFITFFTPTFQRPGGLAKLMASIERQTAARHIEHLVIPDYVGYGIVGGMFGRIPWYAAACRGRYVHVICDDDEIPDEKAVAQVMAFAQKQKFPPVIVAKSVKDGLEYPSCDPIGEPLVSQVDLGCYVMRRDVWLRHAGDYGTRYEGDFDHAHTLWKAGHQFAFCDVLLVEGRLSLGRPEVSWR